MYDKLLNYFMGCRLNMWRMRASIPLPDECKSSALPFELIPLFHIIFMVQCIPTSLT